MSASEERTVAILIAQATTRLESAANTASAAADDDRQLAEQRMGVDAGDMAVLDDPTYCAVLDRSRRLDDVAAAARKVLTEDWS